MKAQPVRRQAARLPRELRVAELMAAAREVFEEKGYADALTTDIAERAGVVEGTIYRYFDSKRDLLIKVLEQWYQEMISDFERELRHVSGTWNRLRFMIWRHLSVLHQEPRMCQLVLLELRADADYPATAVFRMNRRYTHRTLEIVAAAVASGEFRTGVPLSLVRDMIYGGIEHQTWAYLRGLGDFSPDTVADNLADLIYRALAAGPPPGDAAPAQLSQALDRLDRIADRLEAGLGQSRPAG